MRNFTKTNKRKNKIVIIVGGFLLAGMIIVSIATLTDISAYALDYERNYLSKININIDSGDRNIYSFSSFRTEISELEAENIEVVVRFDFDFRDTPTWREFALERDSLVTQADVDCFRKRLADASNLFHNNMLANHLNNINFTAEVHKIDFSPFVILSADCVQVIYRDINVFAKSRNVTNISVSSQRMANRSSEMQFIERQRENSFDYLHFGETLNTSEVLEEIVGTNVVRNGLFTGSGIKVGVKELGVPALDLFDNIVYNPQFSTIFRDHARDVCAIVRYIAPDSRLYVSHEMGFPQFPDFSWFIRQGVSIINNSWQFVVSNGYDARDAFVDYQIYTHFINLVFAAGNAIYIHSPANGRNVITVTGTETHRTFHNRDEWKTHTLGASFKNMSGLISPKPTLAAPFRIRIPVPTSLTTSFYRNLGGTSFSAPLVTGALVLLFEQRPYLSVFQERVLSMLEASADHTVTVDFDASTGYANRDYRLGAGVLSIERLLFYTTSVWTMVECNSHYINNNRVIIDKQIPLIIGQAFKANLYWLGRFAQIKGHQFVTNYDLRLYNPSNVLVAHSSSVKSFSELIIYTATATGTYRLVAFQEGVFNEHTTDLIGLAFSITEASYFNVSGVYYRLDGANAVLRRYKGNSSIFTVPQTVTINGINRNITAIEAFAFAGWTGYEVYIHAGITRIGFRAFTGTTMLRYISVCNQNQHYSSLYGVLFNKTRWMLIQYPIGNHRAIYQIPNSVSSITNGAFRGATNLQHIDINEGVATIASDVFRDTRFSSIIFPSTLFLISPQAFMNNSNLTTVTINRVAARPTTLGVRAFEGTIIHTINLPNWDKVEMYRADVAGAVGWGYVFEPNVFRVYTRPPAIPTNTPIYLGGYTGQRLYMIELPLNWSWLNPLEYVVDFCLLFGWSNSSSHIAIYHGSSERYQSTYHLLHIEILSPYYSLFYGEVLVNGVNVWDGFVVQDINSSVTIRVNPFCIDSMIAGGGGSFFMSVGGDDWILLCGGSQWALLYGFHSTFYDLFGGEANYLLEPQEIRFRFNFGTNLGQFLIMRIMFLDPNLTLPANSLVYTKMLVNGVAVQDVFTLYDLNSSLTFRLYCANFSGGRVICFSIDGNKWQDMMGSSNCGTVCNIIKFSSFWEFWNWFIGNPNYLLGVQEIRFRIFMSGTLITGEDFEYTVIYTIVFNLN